MIKTILEFFGIYAIGFFITLYFCAAHWKEQFRGHIDWKSGPAAATAIFPFIWPLVVVFALPVILIIQFWRLVLHFGVYGELTPRLSAVAKRAGR